MAKAKLDFSKQILGVARGAALLDRVAPGWYDSIDLDHLALDSSTSCVLGQMFRTEGHYATGLYRIAGKAIDMGIKVKLVNEADQCSPNPELNPYYYGFAVKGRFGREGELNQRYDVLNTEWTHAIRMRRKVDSEVDKLKAARLKELLAA